MPIPIASIRLIEYELQNISPKMPEHEKQRLIALTAINHLGAFGCLLKHLSQAKLGTEVSPNEQETVMREFDNAVISLGDIQSAIAGTATAAVERMFTALNEPPADEEGRRFER